MICTSVAPCLSRGLAKNNKIMFKFVLFPGFLASLKVSPFSRKWGDKPYTKAVKQDVSSRFCKGKTIK